MSKIVMMFAGIPALVACLTAQTPPKSPAPAPPAAPAMQIQADLLQLMRGILYPASNVVFSAQVDDPSEAKPLPGKDPAMATDPLVSTYRGWPAIESASLALGESANLLLIAGRKCANGTPVPINDPDWAKFVQELRDASAQAYKAAQSKSQDKMIDVSVTMTDACGHCHRKWRPNRLENRCK